MWSPVKAFSFLDICNMINKVNNTFTVKSLFFQPFPIKAVKIMEIHRLTEYRNSLDFKSSNSYFLPR